MGANRLSTLYFPLFAPATHYWRTSSLTGSIFPRHRNNAADKVILQFHPASFPCSTVYRMRTCTAYHLTHCQPCEKNFFCGPSTFAIPRIWTTEQRKCIVLAFIIELTRQHAKIPSCNFAHAKYRKSLPMILYCCYDLRFRLVTGSRLIHM